MQRRGSKISARPRAPRGGRKQETLAWPVLGDQAVLDDLKKFDTYSPVVKRFFAERRAQYLK